MEPEIAKEQEEITKEYEEQKQLLSNASRTEAKDIREKMFELNSRRIDFDRQLSTIGEQIKKKQAVISRLNEKASKTAIKTTVLGKDADMAEYWHFKDDPSKLYIRVEEQVPVEGADQEMKDEPDSSV